jgi:hypothetical protein
MLEIKTSKTKKYMNLLILNSSSFNFSTSRKKIKAVFALILLASVFCNPSRAVTVNLGSAAGFAVLAGSAITNTGATTITGDVGVFPGSSMTGFGTVTLNGTNQAGNSITQQAKTDLTAAYIDAAGRTATTTYNTKFDLGGLTLLSGVYNTPKSFSLTGSLTLDGLGNPNAVWIFQAATTLTTSSNSSMVLINGAQASNVFWQVGSSATLGTGSVLFGDILALTSITMNTGATLGGSALARNGAVTLDNNTLSASLVSTVPEPATTAMLSLGLICVVLAYRRNVTSRGA